MAATYFVGHGCGGIQAEDEGVCAARDAVG